MKKVTIREIKKHVTERGGEFKKENFTLNGYDAYRVNGRTMTRNNLITAYCMGEI